METPQAYFSGKRITVVGLGLLGGIGDIRFLASCGADLTVTDLKSPQELSASLEQLKEFPNVRYTLGRHDLEDFRNRDLIIKAPAMPLDSPYIAEARRRGIPVTMWSALFARLARQWGATIVGVTGTRGKTTTTAMIADILRRAGKKVFVGGNIRGVPTLAQLPQVTPDSIAVFELDSWKIQGYREEEISPQVSVFTTFYPDHLDYYKGDMNAYLADKAEIFLHQGPEDTLILGEQCAPIVLEKYRDQIHSTIHIAHVIDMPKNWRLEIPGEHNRGNAACARLAAQALGIGERVIKESLEQFKGEPGRLEYRGEVQGVKVYNDTTATTAEATIAALEALDPMLKKNIVLIMGGADKGLPMDMLLPAITAHCKKALLLEGSGTERIRSDIPDAAEYSTLKAAVDAAMKTAVPGDILLLSPAFASFGMFANEYERGDQFNILMTSYA